MSFYNGKEPAATDRSGFTLLEALSMVILMGVLSAAALSILPRSGASSATEAARLASLIRYAQVRAQADIYEWRLVFLSENTFQLGPVIIPGPGFVPAAIPGASGETGILNGDVIAAPGTEVRFDSWGRPLSSSGSVNSSNQEIALTRGEETAIVRIYAETGLVP